MKKKISIIATFRNEEKCLNKFISRINKSFKKFNKIDYELIFIDDYSNDLSNSLIKKTYKKNKRIKLITLKKRYGHSPSLQTGFDFVSKNNYASVIDCDLQDPPELIADHFSKIERKQTLHFVRKKREDSYFQKFYTHIAYLFLYFISNGKIIMNASYFKILPPNVVKKVKKNTEIYPYWNYLFTKLSSENKIIYYIRGKRIYGSSKFSIFTLNPWLTFFSGIHFFRKRFINIMIGLLIINVLILLLVFYNFYSFIVIIFLFLCIAFLIVTMLIFSFLMYYKTKNKRIYCKYK